ncbi:type I polyketide synthase [Amycolatopsis sp. cg13]|uniref:type I polyketide synthase n=1 Tax=Amycolatopsis sp. cg13 TaxID=3238807 RepID=UPI0035239F9F
MTAADTTEPIAVVGIGCRFPNDVRSPDEFWELLREGRDAVGEIPEERWSAYAARGPRFAAALRRAVRNGSFLDHVDEFDPAFFGISPREAELMDPQQRLLLEVAWEALEDAGVPPSDLAGTDAGVFVGVCTHDYGGQMLEDLPALGAWSGIGAAGCAVANRISHALDLRGPSFAVDTACSASLVALHLACQSLRLGESSAALVGGVNVILTPGQSLTLDAAGALSADGRSKAFGSDADGYGRGEGCGVVVLKLLADAQRDGDRVLALVRGSAVRQEGRTDGIMAPSATAQEHVIRQACENAGIEPASVGYLEAHGTGTRLGDPLEAAALGAVYGPGRAPDEACLLGSVKANIGHLEGAAGVAGVIKTVLALGRREVPPTRLTAELNPEIAWDRLGLRVATEATGWPRGAGPRRAGVSGFGYGGTVAHILLEEAPEPLAGKETGAAGELFPLSAQSEPALRARAGELADRLAATTERELPLAGVGATLAQRRSHLAHRAVAVASGRAELITALRGLADDGTNPEVVTGTAAGTEPLVWVFSGHGSHWPGMGAELLERSAAFAGTIDVLEPIFEAELGISARSALVADELTETGLAQALTFAMQVGLAAQWRARGMEPAAVIGHSVGEVAASVVAGALPLEEGAKLICRRSRLLRRIAGDGAMVMVGLPFADVSRRLAGRTDVAAAISAAPSSTVVSGSAPAVAELRAEWESEGLAVRQVDTDVAFHSPQVDPLLADLTSAVWELAHQPATVRMYSTALDDPRTPAASGAGYWAANLRNPVRLHEAVTAAVEDGFHAFLEVSAHPVVAHSIRETLFASGHDGSYVGVTMRRRKSAEVTIRTALAEAHCHGVEVPWERLQPAGPLVPLPRYPWQDRRYWRETTPEDGSGGRGHQIDTHTLIGDPLPIAGTGLRVWTTELDDSTRPYPGSHALRGAEIVPAAVLVLTFLGAVGQREDLLALSGLEMHHPLLTAQRQRVQVVHDSTEVRLAASPAESRADDEDSWLVLAQAEEPPPREALDAPSGTLVPRSALTEEDPAQVRDRLAQVGVPETAFPWTVEQFDRGAGVVRALVHAPAATWASALDAALSVAPAAFEGELALRMVVRIDDVVLAAAAPERVLVEVRRDSDDADLVHVLLADPDGRIAGRLDGLRYPVVDPPAARAEQDDGEAGEEVAAPWRGLAADEALSLILRRVRDQIAVEMRLPPDELDATRPLIQQGFDSVMTVTVRHRLERIFGISLSSSLFWQRPTVEAIARHLTDALAAN